MKIKRIVSTIIATFLICGIVLSAYAERITPYASEEVNSISLILSKRKKITYNVLLTSPDYKVSVTSCRLYRKNGNKGEFVCNMPNGIPEDTVGNMLTSCDISEYITSAGTYYVRATIKAGSSSIPALSKAAFICCHEYDIRTDCRYGTCIHSECIKVDSCS